MVYERRIMLTVYKLLTGKEFNTKDCTSDKIVSIMYIADYLGIHLGDVNFQWGGQSGVCSYDVEYYYNNMDEDAIVEFYATKYDGYVEKCTDRLQRVFLKIISDCNCEYIAAYLYLSNLYPPHSFKECHKELLRRRPRYKDVECYSGAEELEKLLEIK